LPDDNLNDYLRELAGLPADEEESVD